MDNIHKVSKLKSKSKATRSRAGCANCKKRKKKCDEIKPICTGCYKRNLVCQYGEDEDFLEDGDNEPTVSSVPWRDILLDSALVQLLTPWQDPELQQLLEIRSLNFDFNLDLEPDQHHEEGDSPDMEPLLLLELPVKLTRKELMYLETFCKEILPDLSVLPQEYNHFIRLYIPMALKDKAVLYSLISWGCRTKKSHSADYKSLDDEYDNFISLVKAELEIKSKDLNKFNFISSMVSYIVLVSMEISFGDTTKWSEFYNSSFHMMNSMPGTLHYLLDNYSIEGRLLGESYAYYDIMASQSNENGTFYPFDDYKELLKVDNSVMHDALQGCMRPLTSLIGKTLTVLVEYNSLRTTASTDNSIESRIGAFVDDSIGSCDRYNIISEMLEKANNLDNEISFCKPDLEILKMLKTREELENHLTLFEAMQIATQLYLRQVIKNLPPIVPEVELLTMNLRQDMKFLIDKQIFKKSLAFPMLLLGLCVNDLRGREQVKGFFEELIKMCGYLSSYEKIWIVIQKVWELNNNGQVYVDYFKITKQLGWKLNLAR